MCFILFCSRSFHPIRCDFVARSLQGRLTGDSRCEPELILFDGDKEGTPCLGRTEKYLSTRHLKKSRVRGTRQVSGRVNREIPGACVNRCPGIVGRGTIRKSATAHDRGHHFNAAVRTGWSQSAVVSVSSRLTVSDHPAMSSEVTKLPTSERLMRKLRFSSMRRAALYIK